MIEPNPHLTMTTIRTFPFVVSLLTIAAFVSPAPTLRGAELDELKAQMELMQKQMQQMQNKIIELEQQNKQRKQTQTASTTTKTTSTTKAAPAPPSEGPTELPQVDANGNQVVTIKPSAVTITGNPSQVRRRDAIYDQQEAAPRPNDLTLDPQYRGFIPVPNTPVLIKFNAKPHVDFTNDPENTGNPDRFVPATIPVDGDFFKGGGNQFNVNGKGSQLSFDVRAPGVPGDPRFYFQNDFFGGSGGEFPFRVRHIYGEIYNFVVGQTFSVFEDPDAWPDTVDAEGPNSAIFARRPLVRYQVPLNKHWQVNFGLEKPGADIDASFDPDARAVNHAPDGGFNIRYEDAAIGHVQLGTIFRDIGVKGPITGDQSTFGWGVNLSGSFNLTKMDTVQTQVSYGDGLFHFFNDNFLNNDAAFDENGELKAIPAFGVMAGYTHKWSEYFRSTASYGYVHLDNEFSQGPRAYHQTHYGSLNLVWQARKRLSVGFEVLYGRKEEKGGAEGDALRLQIGVLYSLFD